MPLSRTQPPPDPTAVRTIVNFGSFLLAKAGAIAFFLVGVRAFMLNAGPEAYGAVNLILVLYTYLWIADAGVGYAVNLRIGRRLARARASAERTRARVADALSKALPFYVAIGLAIAAAAQIAQGGIAVALFGTSDYEGLIAWTGIAAPAVMISALAGAVLRAFDRVYLVNLSQLLLDAWRGSCLVVLSTSFNPVDSIGQAFAIGAAVRALVDVVLVSRFAGWTWLVPRWSWQNLRLDVRLGAPTMGSLVLFAMFFSADRIFVSHALSLEAVAIYSLAADMHTKAYFLLWAANSALYQPLLSRHATGKTPGPLAHVNVVTAMAVAMLYYVPLALFSTEIVSLWIDPRTAEGATPIVRAMLAGSVAYLLAAALENAYLRTRGSVGKPMLVHAAMLVTLLAALGPLSASFGVAGVGWSYTLANFVFLAGIVILVQRTRARTRATTT